MMVPKIPIRPRDIPDVRTHGYQPAAGFEAASRFIQRATQAGFVWQMLEKITRENEVQTVRSQWPACGTILQKQFHLRRQLFARIRIEVHGEFPPTLNLIDEFAIATTQ